MSVRPQRPRLVRWARLRADRHDRHGRALLLAPERGLALNATGAAIVRLCTGAHTRDEIVATLAATYAVPVAIVAADVDLVLALLARLALLDEAAP